MPTRRTPEALRCAELTSRSLLFAFAPALAAVALACGARSDLSSSHGDAAAGPSSSGAGGSATGCAPSGQPVPLAHDVHGAYAIAVDATDVYWSTADGDLFKKAKDGTGAAVTLASGEGTILDLALDESRVYWVASATGQVKSALKSGGPPALLVSGQNTPTAVAVSADRLYWLNRGSGIAAGSVMRANKDGTAMAMLADQIDMAVDLAIDDTAAYFSAQGFNPGVFRVPIEGGTSVAVVQTKGPAYGVALDATYVYFLTAANLGGEMGSVGRVLKTGGMTETIASSVAGPVFVAVDGKDVYWLSFGDTALRGTLSRAPIGGGPTTTLAETPGVLFSALALGDEAVFWVRDWQLNTPPEDGVSALRLCK